MPRKTLMYKGYQGTIAVDMEDYSLWGRILFIPQKIIYRGKSFAELNEHFQQSVDEYLYNRPQHPVTYE